jgi:hypothetical protein
MILGQEEPLFTRVTRDPLTKFGVLPPFRGPGAEQCETRDKHQERPQSPASVHHLLSSAERTARAALRSGSACRAAQRGCVEAIVTQAFRRELCIVGEGMSPPNVPNWPNPTSSSRISTTFGTPFGAWTGGKTAPCRSRGRCGRQSREVKVRPGQHGGRIRRGRCYSRVDQFYLLGEAKSQTCR